MADDSSRRRRVAVLGGGPAGLALACALTDTPELRQRFDVVVYQMGWRLGGKGASGRREVRDGQGQLLGHRIEEHGLHIWFGFYDNAFWLTKRTFDELGIAGDPWWEHAFEPLDAVNIYCHSDAPAPPPGQWTTFRLQLPSPPRGGRVGDAVESERDVVAVFAALGHWLGRFLHRQADAIAALDLTGVGRLLQALEQGLIHEVHRLASAFLDHHHQSSPPEAQQRSFLDDEVELGLAMLKGLAADEIFHRGTDHLEAEDLRDWLCRHGAARATVDRSPLLRAAYDLMFAYLEGDRSRPNFAAGTALNALAHIECFYREAFMWRFRGSMADVVFAPMYEMLVKREVRFEFFHRVVSLGLDADGGAVERVELERQAQVAGDADYTPLAEIGSTRGWPVEPLWDQLVHPDRTADFESGNPCPTGEARVLCRAEGDFDDVVLAIPIGALASITAELQAADQRFATMIRGGSTVATKALQLWLTEAPAEIASAEDSQHDPNRLPPGTSFCGPFDTWADMGQILPVEWDQPAAPGAHPAGVAYLCSVLQDPSAGQPAEDLAASVRLLAEETGRGWWPRAYGPDGAVDWRVLFDPANGDGAARLAFQYQRANVSPSERYVLSPAGTITSRLKPTESGFANLWLAGDWTLSYLNAGCVEAAVASALEAAAGIIGS